MGFQLTQQAVAVALPLLGNQSGAAAKVLMLMAQTAKDTDEQPRYWAGRDSFVVVLGYGDIWPADDDHTPPADAARAAAYRAVRRAIRELEDLGCITTLEQAHRGHTAVYAVHPAKARRPENGGHAASPNGGHAASP